ncbi:iron-containing alcohol dehydrogenase [bacterium]|nr:iron-containing alcohol dehydrogenase [bacterium]
MKAPQAGQVVHLREGALAELAAICRFDNASQILFVVDEDAYQFSGAVDELEESLQEFTVTRFSDFEANPKLEDVERGVKLCREVDPDLIVALGGGTAIDIAKLIACIALQQLSPRAVALEGLADGVSLPLVAIPTTAGTGSEATPFAVMYMDGAKYSIAAPQMLPNVAIIDPTLTYSLPPQLTAATGLDAFCQAMESIWAVEATDASVAYASIAARLALDHLPQAVKNPNPPARLAMARASHMAGKAIAISKTTLPHALSYAITSQYGVPHGIAVAMTFRAVMTYNLGITANDCNDPRGHTHVQKRLKLILDVLGVGTIEEAQSRIVAWFASLGVETDLRSAGIESIEQLEEVVSQVNAQRLQNNPRQASTEEIFALLSKDFQLGDAACAG